MSLISKILARKKLLVIDDRDFGRLHQTKTGWEGHGLSLWNLRDLQVLLDAGDEGPSTDQREFLRSLKNERANLKGTIEDVVSRHAAETCSVRPLVLRFSSIYIPKIGSHFMWRAWYDVEGEDQYSYGAEITDWETIVPFTED